MRYPRARRSRTPSDTAKLVRRLELNAHQACARTETSRRSGLTDGEQRLDGTALVHGRVGVGDVVEVGGVVDDDAGVDVVGENVPEQFADVLAGRRNAALDAGRCTRTDARRSSVKSGVSVHLLAVRVRYSPTEPVPVPALRAARARARVQRRLRDGLHSFPLRRGQTTYCWRTQSAPLQSSSRY
jgi:hypothetical protein